MKTQKIVNNLSDNIDEKVVFFLTCSVQSLVVLLFHLPQHLEIGQGEPEQRAPESQMLHNPGAGKGGLSAL